MGNYGKRDKPKLVGKDIYDYIATHSSLTRSEVKECFMVYAQMMEELSNSQYLPKDIWVNLPYIGNFRLKKTVGRKKGTTYSMPVSPACKGKTKLITVEEDQPTIYRWNLKTLYPLSIQISEENVIDV